MKCLLTTNNERATIKVSPASLLVGQRGFVFGTEKLIPHGGCVNIKTVYVA